MEELLIGYGKYKLRQISIGDLEFLRRLRNNPLVYRFLSSTEQISEEEQRRWYEQTYKKTLVQQRFILEKNQIPIGTASIVGINLEPEERYCMTGGILLPDYWGKGNSDIATKLLDYYVYDILGIDRVFVGIRKSNKSSIALTERNGFSEINPEDFNGRGFALSDSNYRYFSKHRTAHQPLEGICASITFNPKDLKLFPK